MNIMNIEHISKIFGEKTIFDDASIGIQEGDKIGIVGINGTGKSTLLRMIAGDEVPDSGNIIRQFQLKLAWLPQEPKFPENATILSYAGDDETGWKVQSNLSQLGIMDYSTPIEQLSGGQKRKVALAKVLAQDFDVLLLDEPTSGLDPVVRDDILDLLWDFVQDEQNAVLISSHITSDLEKVADYIVFLNQGRVVFEKPKDELRYRWGMLRCGAERFRTLDPADLVAWRQQDYEYEALVYDREAAHKKYPDALIDPATIDEIMLMHIRGEKP